MCVMCVGYSTELGYHCAFTGGTVIGAQQPVLTHTGKIFKNLLVIVKEIRKLKYVPELTRDGRKCS